MREPTYPKFLQRTFPELFLNCRKKGSGKGTGSGNGSSNIASGKGSSPCSVKDIGCSLLNKGSVVGHSVKDKMVIKDIKASVKSVGYSVLDKGSVVAYSALDDRNDGKGGQGGTRDLSGLVEDRVGDCDSTPTTKTTTTNNGVTGDPNPDRAAVTLIEGNWINQDSSKQGGDGNQDSSKQGGDGNVNDYNICSAYTIKDLPIASLAGDTQQVWNPRVPDDNWVPHPKDQAEGNGEDNGNNNNNNNNNNGGGGNNGSNNRSGRDGDEEGSDNASVNSHSVKLIIELCNLRDVNAVIETTGLSLEPDDPLVDELEQYRQFMIKDGNMADIPLRHCRDLERNHEIIIRNRHTFNEERLEDGQTVYAFFTNRIVVAVEVRYKNTDKRYGCSTPRTRTIGNWMHRFCQDGNIAAPARVYFNGASLNTNLSFIETGIDEDDVLVLLPRDEPMKIVFKVPHLDDRECPVHNLPTHTVDNAFKQLLNRKFRKQMKSSWPNLPCTCKFEGRAPDVNNTLEQCGLSPCSLISIHLEANDGVAESSGKFNRTYRFKLMQGGNERTIYRTEEQGLAVHESLMNIQEEVLVPLYEAKKEPECNQLYLLFSIEVKYEDIVVDEGQSFQEINARHLSPIEVRFFENQEDNPDKPERVSGDEEEDDGMEESKQPERRQSTDSTGLSSAFKQLASTDDQRRLSGMSEDSEESNFTHLHDNRSLGDISSENPRQRKVRRYEETSQADENVSLSNSAVEMPPPPPRAAQQPPPQQQPSQVQLDPKCMDYFIEAARKSEIDPKEHLQILALKMGVSVTPSGTPSAENVATVAGPVAGPVAAATDAPPVQQTTRQETGASMSTIGQQTTTSSLTPTSSLQESQSMALGQQLQQEEKQRHEGMYNQDDLPSDDEDEVEYIPDKEKEELVVEDEGWDEEEEDEKIELSREKIAVNRAVEEMSDEDLLQEEHFCYRFKGQMKRYVDRGYKVTSLQPVVLSDKELLLNEEEQQESMISDVVSFVKDCIQEIGAPPEDYDYALCCGTAMNKPNMMIRLSQHCRRDKSDIVADGVERGYVGNMRCFHINVTYNGFAPTVQDVGRVEKQLIALAPEIEKRSLRDVSGVDEIILWNIKEGGNGNVRFEDNKSYLYGVLFMAKRFVELKVKFPCVRHMRMLREHSDPADKLDTSVIMTCKICGHMRHPPKNFLNEDGSHPRNKANNSLKVSCTDIRQVYLGTQSLCGNKQVTAWSLSTEVNHEFKTVKYEAFAERYSNKACFLCDGCGGTTGFWCIHPGCQAKKGRNYYRRTNCRKAKKKNNDPIHKIKGLFLCGTCRKEHLKVVRLGELQVDD